MLLLFSKLIFRASCKLTCCFCALRACPVNIISGKTSQRKVFRLNDFTFKGLSNIMYKIGNTNKVKKVEVNKPPITTVAKGRCTSAPADCENAIGKKPNAAAAAVNNTGRKRSVVPFTTKSFRLSYVCFFNSL